MKKTVIVFACVALMTSMSAFAAKTKKSTSSESTSQEAPTKRPLIEEADHNISGQGYGMAGCGLGSLIFGTKGGIIQIFATTTNGTFGNQTFGITTGTLNCKPSKMAHTAELFVTVNKETLAKDISRGNGESIDSLSQIVGCKDASLFGAKLQENYKNIFPTSDASTTESSNKILEVIKADAQLSKTCSLG